MTNAERPAPAEARPSSRRSLAELAGALVLLLAVGTGLSACGSSSAGPLKASQIMTVDSLSKTVHLLLEGSETSSSDGFNFDGFADGALRIRVPIGWTVIVDCKNDSTVITHSCAISDDLPISPTAGESAGAVAFAGATTPNAVNGLPCGAAATFSFVASRIGNFRIACLVIGHEADGMWDWLEVTNGGAPGVTT